MYVVAIHSLKKEKETLSSTLAAVLGVTIYEALARLRAPGNGPFIVAFSSEKERAAYLVERLQSEGFNASLLTAGEIEAESRALIARRFNLGKAELDVTTEKGESHSFAFKNIDLILRGTGIVRDVTTETVKNRSVSLGRAALSGGMMITKTTKNLREVTTEERQAFFNIYAKDSSTVVFRENALVYDSLGPELQPTRAANFIHLIAGLRRCCPGVVYDERLLSRAGQAALLGPSLSPEENLAVAAALLSKLLRNEV